MPVPRRRRGADASKAQILVPHRWIRDRLAPGRRCGVAGRVGRDVAGAGLAGVVACVEVLRVCWGDGLVALGVSQRGGVGAGDGGREGGALEGLGGVVA